MPSRAGAALRGGYQLRLWCPNGHPWTEAVTHNEAEGVRRKCRRCKAANQRRYRDAHLEEDRARKRKPPFDPSQWPGWKGTT